MPEEYDHNEDTAGNADESQGSNLGGMPADELDSHRHMSAANADRQPQMSGDELDSHRHITNHISSSLSGPGIGDLVAAKKANLLHAQGEPARGRRETPVHDPWPRRKLFIRGILLGLLVFIFVVVVIVVIAGSQDFGHLG